MGVLRSPLPGVRHGLHCVHWTPPGFALTKYYAAHSLRYPERKKSRSDMKIAAAKAEADDIKAKLEAEGAKVTLK